MILVTGGTGLLGSNLLFRLCQTEEKLVATYRSNEKREQVKKLFQSLDEKRGGDLFKKIIWRKCDILDMLALEEAMRGCKTVYHCAALVSYRIRDFSKMMKVNGLGTANVVNMALEQGIKRFCHVSSTSAVGKIKDSYIYKVSESNKWTQDKRTNGYAISKYTAEKEVWRGAQEGLSVVIINPSVIFGPGNWSESSLTIFGAVSNGLKFYTKGSNAFVDVRDVVRTMIHLMNSSVSGQRYLCTGTNCTFKNLFQLIAQELKQKEPKILAGRLACEMAWRLDSLKAIFTGKQTLTKESVQSSQSSVVYDSSKLMEFFPFEYITLKETIAYTAKYKM